MARRTRHDDDWDEDEFDESDDEDEEPAIPCPYCRKEIHEESPQCPHCGNYLSDEDAPPARKPWWLIVGVLACLYAIYRWIVG